MAEKNFDISDLIGQNGASKLKGKQDGSTQVVPIVQDNVVEPSARITDDVSATSSPLGPDPDSPEFLELQNKAMEAEALRKMQQKSVTFHSPTAGSGSGFSSMESSVMQSPIFLRPHSDGSTFLFFFQFLIFSALLGGGWYVYSSMLNQFLEDPVSVVAGQEVSRENAVMLSSLFGQVEVRRHASRGWSSVKQGDYIYMGDSIRTDFDSSVTIVWDDGSQFRLSEETEVVFESIDVSQQLINEGKSLSSDLEISQDGGERLSLSDPLSEVSNVVTLVSGEFYFRGGGEVSLVVKTPLVTVNSSSLGASNYSWQFERLNLSVLQEEVSFWWRGQKVTLKAGYETSLAEDSQKVIVSRYVLSQWLKLNMAKDSALGFEVSDSSFAEQDLLLEYPVRDLIVSSKLIMVRGIVLEDLEVTINGVLVEIMEDNSFVQAVDLEEGENLLEIVGGDFKKSIKVIYQPGAVISAPLSQNIESSEDEIVLEAQGSNQGSIVIDWRVSLIGEEDEFRLLLSKSPFAEFPGADEYRSLDGQETGYEWTGLTKGVYYVRLCMFDIQGNSCRRYSEDVEVEVTGDPVYSQDIYISTLKQQGDSGSEVFIEWEVEGGEFSDGFYILVSSPDYEAEELTEGEADLKIFANSTIRSRVVDQLLPGAKYIFRLCVKSGDLCVTYSPQRSFTLFR